MIPEMTARGSAFTPPGPVTGQTSTHLPQRVQASAIAATRSLSAASNVTVMRMRPVLRRSLRILLPGPARRNPVIPDTPGRREGRSAQECREPVQAVTAMPCTSIIISGWAKPCTVIAALAGKSLPNSSPRSSVMRVV